MPFTTAALNQALDALNGGTPTSIVGKAALYSAYSANGASNELSGGSYARQTVTWAAASGGNKVTTGSPAATFSTPAASTVAFVGLWDSTGTTFAGMGANGGSSQFAFTAATTGNLFTAPGSAYSNGDQVVIWSGAGTTTPGGFTVGTIYFVVSASGATFQLSATSGGSAITVSAAGSGLVQKVIVETFAAAGTFQLSSDTLTIV